MHRGSCLNRGGKAPLRRGAIRLNHGGVSHDRMSQAKYFLGFDRGRGELNVERGELQKLWRPD